MTRSRTLLHSPQKLGRHGTGDASTKGKRLPVQRLDDGARRPERSFDPGREIFNDIGVDHELTIVE